MKKTVKRLSAIALTALFLAANLSGCIWEKNLRLSQLEEFKRNVYQKYPDASVSCKYDYGAGVHITVQKQSFDEESAYTLLGWLKPIVSDEEFIEDLFELYEKESHGEPNWKNGMRPVIWFDLSANGKYRYRFTASANKEVYNSGRSPDSYTWDGYKTWYGSDNENGGHRSISAEEVEEGIKKYS